MKKTIGSLMALTLVACFATASRADYSFTSTITPSSQTVGTASAYTFAGVTSGTLSGTQGVSLGSVADTTTQSPSSTDKGNFTVTLAVALSQTSPSTGSGTITITGNLDVLRSDTGGQFSTFTPLTNSGPVTIGNDTYTISNVTYNQPLVNKPLNSAGSGGFSALINVTAVPEPASVALLGLGGVAGLFGRRALRRRPL